MHTILDMPNVMDRLKKRRPIFVSEADFQLELAWNFKLNNRKGVATEYVVKEAV